MSRSILFTALTLAALSAPAAFAQATTPTPVKPGMGMDKQMPRMQENMKAMRGMGGPMMSGGMGGGMAKGGPKDAAAGGMMQHHAMMEKRVDMMQMMMEQMVQHQQMTESMPRK